MSKLENFFNNHPIATAVILILLYIATINLAGILVTLLFGDLPYVTFLYIDFAFEFVFLAILWLIIAPFVLHLPNGDESLREYARSIQLIPVRPLKRNIGFGLGAAAIFFLCCLMFSLLVGTYTFDLNIIIGSPEARHKTVSSLTPGIWEEVAFRGVLLTFLLKKYSKRKAIIIDSLVFGMAHFMNFLMGVALLETIIQMAYATALGFVFCYMFIKTESIIPCIIFHYLINATVNLFLNVEILVDYWFIIFVIFIMILPEILIVLLVKYSTKNEKSTKNLPFLEEVS